MKIDWHLEIEKVNKASYDSIYGFENSNKLYLKDNKVNIPNSNRNNYFPRTDSSYFERYERIIDDHNYHFRYPNGIFAFRIHLDDKSDLIKSSYIFYPNTEMNEKLINFNEYEFVEIFGHEKKVPVRIDFDIENANINNHPIMHITINECENNRMHLDTIITPLQFIHMIAYMYEMDNYCTIWKSKITNNKSLINNNSPFFSLSNLSNDFAIYYKNKKFVIFK